MGIWANCLSALVALGIGHMPPLPPSEYVNSPAKREVQVTFKSPLAVHLACGGELPSEWQIYACAGVNKDWIIMPDPCKYKDESYARLMCHELGHTKGWPKDHPNAEAYEPLKPFDL